MGKSSKNKGHSFERDVAALVIEMLSPLDAKKGEVYRTPLSGGHPFADQGDLCIAPRLEPFFPFVVECKAHKTWSPGDMMSMPLREAEAAWIEQVKTAAQNSKQEGLVPLLIMRALFNGIYVAGPHVELCRMVPALNRKRPNLRFRHCRELWTLWPWKVFSQTYQDALQERMALPSSV